MLKGEEVRSVPQQNVSFSAQGLEVKEISSPSGRGRSVSLDIPLYRTMRMVRCIRFGASLDHAADFFRTQHNRQFQGVFKGR